MILLLGQMGMVEGVWVFEVSDIWVFSSNCTKGGLNWLQMVRKGEGLELELLRS